MMRVFVNECLAIGELTYETGAFSFVPVFLFLFLVEFSDIFCFAF